MFSIQKQPFVREFTLQLPTEGMISNVLMSCTQLRCGLCGHICRLLCHTVGDTPLYYNMAPVLPWKYVYLRDKYNFDINLNWSCTNHGSCTDQAPCLSFLQLLQAVDVLSGRDTSLSNFSADCQCEFLQCNPCNLSQIGLHLPKRRMSLETVGECIRRFDNQLQEKGYILYVLVFN